MNSKRSMWKLLVSVASVGFLVTNCTIKNATDDDGCTPGDKKECNACNGVTGSQTCQDDGSYGVCDCPGSNNAGASSGGASSNGGSGSPSGGKSSTAGSGGSIPTDGGASNGEGGEGGEGPAPIDPTDCYGCLNTQCATEWEDCALEDENNPETAGNYCLSSEGDGTGQIEAVIDCIEAERKKGGVKRDVVRSCGSSLGQSTDPDFFLWPPIEMTAVTAQVLNCMADAPDEMTPGTWANSSNIPSNGTPKPWLDMTCAKLACTSAIK
jgi:hypothetical protein